MSGHSKWSTIKRKKGVADARRGKIFTKLIREIATAARIGGGEAGSNSRLRLAMERARLANMPKENIQRAIKTGTGANAAQVYDEVSYEGYGPGGTALYVEVLTDNKNRTVGEVRHVLAKYGGNLGASGCVAYLFEKKGSLSFDRQGLEADRVLEAALEAGADDVTESENSIDVITSVANFEKTKRTLESAGFIPARAGILMEPSSTVALEGSEAESMLRLADALEDLDDVQNVYANFDISEEEMSRIAG